MNIYDGCISNSEVFCRSYSTPWDEQLDQKKKQYEDMGYKVVFVFAPNPFRDAARVVLYDKRQKIPDCMREYRFKYVRFHGHWHMESQLGICDKCGNYERLVCFCKDGWLCEECSAE